MMQHSIRDALWANLGLDVLRWRTRRRVDDSLDLVPWVAAKEVHRTHCQASTDSFRMGTLLFRVDEVTKDALDLSLIFRDNMP